MRQPKSARGFSFTEALVSVAIILVMTAIAVPYLDTSWAGYRLSGAATNVANIFQRARFEAVRNNTVIPCLVQQQTNNSWLLWVDLNNNGVLDTNEPEVLLPGPVTILPAGVAPGAASMGYTNTQTVQGAIAFDSRGAVNFGAAAPTVYVLYLSYSGQPNYGYKAVTVIPAGKTKVWGASSGGTWHSP